VTAVIETEVEPPALTTDAATTLVNGIRSSFELAWVNYADGCQQLVEAYQGRAWEPLGLKDWGEFVTHTLDVDHLRIPKSERFEFVRILTEGGLSLRDVGAAIGVTKSTVQRRPRAGVPNGTGADGHRGVRFIQRGPGLLP
jgi:hypothetical protein